MSASATLGATRCGWQSCERAATAKSQSDSGVAWPLARDPVSSTAEILVSGRRRSRHRAITGRLSQIRS